MNNVAIEVENLGKLYHLRGQRLCYHTFRDALTRQFSGLWKRLQQNRLASATPANTIWALKDVSFQVNRGEVVGLIGRNGAGKSTLLKILSRITEPTEGQARIHGRIGSLLEVGTGFHPELTGRENTYLSGAVLGMRRAEIDRKFDEIIAFAEVEKFVDTPCKHYSSGMYLRLAFSVAAHLETEILLIDEVLAVGDAAFQKKCLGKMGEVAHQGRTVIFISHNMGAVTALCPNSFLLANGRLIQSGPSPQVVADYLSASSVASFVEVHPSHHLKGDQAIKIQRLRLTNMRGEGQAEFQIWEPMQIHIGFADSGAIRSAYFLVNITGSDGQVILSSYQSDTTAAIRLPCEGNAVRVTVPALMLAPGDYLISIGVYGQVRQLHDWVEHPLTFRIRPNIFQGGAFDNRAGRVLDRWKWEPGAFPPPEHRLRPEPINGHRMTELTS